MILDVQLQDVLLILVSLFLYGLFVVGWAVLYLDSLRNFYVKAVMKKRLKARSKELRKESRLEEHLRRVLSATIKNPMEPRQFIQVHAMLFISITIIGMRNVSLLSTLLMAGMVTAMPYLLLKAKLESIRRKGSFEGERLISEFLNQYRICHCNIYRTMEQVLHVSEGTKVSGGLLFKLLLELRNTGNSVVIREAADRFAYGVNTNWSRMLANNIRIAAENGTNVTLSLEDILIQLREARALAEERKRLNSEAARMVVFLIPILYILTVLTSIYYLDLSPMKFLQNQVYTPQGFILILAAIFLFLLNLVLIEFVSNQRFDY